MVLRPLKPAAQVSWKKKNSNSILRNDKSSLKKKIVIFFRLQCWPKNSKPGPI